MKHTNRPHPEKIPVEDRESPASPGSVGEDDAILADFLHDRRVARLEQVLNGRTDALTVVLDRVHHPHNIAAVIRSADAFGIRDIHLIGEEFPHNRDISLGSEQWVNLRRHATHEEAIALLRSEGYEIVVTAPEGNCGDDQIAVPAWELPFERKLAVVFGNEREGVSEAIFSAASFRTFIPMFGFVESLNISVACAIVLYSSTFSHAEGIRRVAPLDAPSRDALRGKWLRQSTRHSARILRELARRKGDV